MYLLIFFLKIFDLTLNLNFMMEFFCFTTCRAVELSRYQPEMSLENESTQTLTLKELRGKNEY